MPAPSSPSVAQCRMGVGRMAGGGWDSPRAGQVRGRQLVRSPTEKAGPKGAPAERVCVSGSPREPLNLLSSSLSSCWVEAPVQPGGGPSLGDLPGSPPGENHGVPSPGAASEPRQGWRPADSHADSSLATSPHGPSLHRPLCPPADLASVLMAGFDDPRGP